MDMSKTEEGRAYGMTANQVVRNMIAVTFTGLGCPSDGHQKGLRFEKLVKFHGFYFIEANFKCQLNVALEMGGSNVRRY